MPFIVNESILKGTKEIPTCFVMPAMSLNYIFGTQEYEKGWSERKDNFIHSMS